MAGMFQKEPTQVERAMALLGHQVRDMVTGAEGVVESISFDLYGCVQAVVRPKVNEKGEYPDGRWFDTKRLTVTSGSPVMDVPTFKIEPNGPADKPLPR